jgi:uncharacterized protein YbgA (DUF1722 family)
MTRQIERLRQVLILIGKEDRLLMDVANRLFPSVRLLDSDWFANLLSSPEGTDRLESFLGKFSRMHDTMTDKLLPEFRRAVGEIPGTAIDNLNRAEQLNLIEDAQRWVSMRQLRNRLVHEYLDDPLEMLPALNIARDFVAELHEAFLALSAYLEPHLKSSGS